MPRSPLLADRDIKEGGALASKKGKYLETPPRHYYFIASETPFSSPSPPFPKLGWVFIFKFGALFFIVLRPSPWPTVWKVRGGGGGGGRGRNGFYCQCHKSYHLAFLLLLLLLPHLSFSVWNSTLLLQLEPDFQHFDSSTFSSDK